MGAAEGERVSTLWGSFNRYKNCLTFTGAHSGTPGTPSEIPYTLLRRCELRAATVEDFNIRIIAPYIAVAVFISDAARLDPQKQTARFAARSAGACGPRGIPARVTGTPAVFFATLLLIHAAPVSFGEMIS